MLTNFETVMNQVSELIKKTEIKMRANSYVRCASFMDLKWEMYGKHMRIMLKGKPLLECPFDVRAEQFEHITGLVGMAKQEMNKHLSGISQDKIDRVEDVLNQM